jgi:pimeloyl-ACP methyl ester carboxylesterase
MNDALAFANTFGSQRFHVVGHDWGGQLAWLLASTEPRRIASLTVLSRPHPRAFSAALKADPAQSERSRHHQRFDHPSTAARLLKDDARGLHSMLRSLGVPASDSDVYVARLAQPGALEAALQWYRAARSGEPVRVGAIEVPTLYVWGDADSTVGRPAAEATAEHVTAPFQFQVIAGGGHTLSDQFPDQVTQLLLSHIGSHAA